jgi:hypothetical protein
MSKPTFEVDKKGLSKLLTRRGTEFVVLELIQNALDENADTVEVDLSPVPGKRGLYTLMVKDDNPEGFKNLSHAFTLFAESQKGANPKQRGRFNLGEKLVIAACETSFIKTTKGTVVFNDKERTHKREHTEKGSIFQGNIRLKKEEVQRIEEAVRQVIMPPGITIYFNGEMNGAWDPVKIFGGTLATVITDDEGYLRPTRRKTDIEVYEIDGDETPHLYELGIPVVPIDCTWHINVVQKVPLNSDRDNVTPAYMRELLALVLNEMHERMSKETTKAAWINEALETGGIDKAAVDTVMTGRYGKKRMTQDPSDREAEKFGMSQGYTVIPSGSYTKPQWKTIRESGTVLPAGQVTPSPRPYSDDPNAPLADFIPEEDWTKGMRRVAAYSRRLAKLLLDVTALRVTMVKTNNKFDACYGKGSTPELTFNVRRLGRRWFDDVKNNTEGLDSLLIHEFGHQYSSDHLSQKYHEALCDLGAKLKSLATAGKLRGLKV